MAEDNDLPQTVLGTSEKFYHYNCSPCKEDGIYKKANKYCESCKLYYCKKCLGDHNKFPALRGHMIKNVNSQPKSARARTASLKMTSKSSNSQLCEHHPEEMIKMFCGEHDLVCCTVCLALNHKECNDVHYILNICNGIRTRQDYKDYVEGIADMRSVYEDTKQSILNERKKLNDVKTEIIAEINYYKQDLVSRIDELERKSIENVNERYKQITEKMDLTLGHVDELLKKVTKNERDIKHASEAMLFVNTKHMSLMNSEADAIDTNIDKIEGLSFSLDTRVKDILHDFDGLATFNLPLKVLAEKEYEIAVNHNIGQGVVDSCILEDDTLVFTYDSTVKRLDVQYDILCSILVKGECWGVCSISRLKKLAVAIRDKETVQFVTYSDKTMTLSNSFTVGAPCKGICCRNDYLFVTCGGGDNDTVPGHIRQYSIKGNLVCTIETDKTGRDIFTSPRFIAYKFATNDIYITDRYNGIVALGQNEQVERFSYNSFLKNGFGLCLTNKSNMFVSGYNSYNIQQYDEKFRYVGTVINFIHRKHRPTCILLDEFRRQLIVGFYKHSKIYVYDVEC